MHPLFLTRRPLRAVMDSESHGIVCYAEERTFSRVYEKQKGLACSKKRLRRCGIRLPQTAGAQLCGIPIPFVRILFNRSCSNTGRIYDRTANRESGFDWIHRSSTGARHTFLLWEDRSVWHSASAILAGSSIRVVTLLFGRAVFISTLWRSSAVTAYYL